MFSFYPTQHPTSPRKPRGTPLLPALPILQWLDSMAFLSCVPVTLCCQGHICDPVLMHPAVHPKVPGEILRGMGKYHPFQHTMPPCSTKIGVCSWRTIRYPLRSSMKTNQGLFQRYIRTLLRCDSYQLNHMEHYILAVMTHWNSRCWSATPADTSCDSNLSLSSPWIFLCHDEARPAYEDSVLIDVGLALGFVHPHLGTQCSYGSIIRQRPLRTLLIFHHGYAG
jgi:hypothetical protein